MDGMSIELIRKSRNMPFLKVGMWVKCPKGNKGKITGTRGGYLLIRIDGSKKSSPYHPTWMLTFYTSNGAIIKDYKTTTHDPIQLP